MVVHVVRSSRHDFHRSLVGALLPVYLVRVRKGNGGTGPAVEPLPGQERRPGEAAPREGTGAWRARGRRRDTGPGTERAVRAR
ncbi:predicted protein [Streptomyces sp. SPB78]|nr:predicted protein [Streptomyces sp. SPB78]